MITATLRDIAIIVLAIQTLLVNILLGVLIWQVWRLVKIIQTEVKPIIEDTQETVSTVRGTTGFVSENVVEPVVRTSKNVTRWRATLSALTGELRNPGSRNGN